MATLGDSIADGAVSIFTGPFGSALHSHDYVNEGVPVVPTEAIVSGRLNTTFFPKIPREKANELARYELRHGDLVFARRGAQACGLSAMVEEECEGAIAGTGTIVARINNRTRIDPKYFSILVGAPSSVAWLKVHAVGATMPNLNSGIISSLPVSFPPLSEQKAIARILGTLDDKIELNRRMNATLEAMARALFQSWFVNALPDDGSLPEGWELSTIGAEAKVVGGSTPSTKSPEFWENGEFHWVTPKDFSALQSKVLIGSSRKVTKAGLDQISSGMLPENTVLLSSRAPVGYLALTKIETAINQGFIAMICPRRLSPEYVMLWADSIMDQIKQAASGTTFAEISKATFRPFPIIVPSADRLKQFTDIVRAFYERIAANERQSVTLAETRDTLLPKFLSGELRTEEVANAG